VIVLPAAPLSPAEAAARAGPSGFWLASPGEADLGVERQFVGADPVRVARGSGLAGLDELEEVWRQERLLWQGAPGVPIAVGHLSYDLGRHFERLRSAPRTSLAPELEFHFHDALWVSEPGGSAIWARDAKAAARLQARLGVAAEVPDESLGPLHPLEPPERHLQGVRRILDYLQAGDVYQVNLARRLAAPLATTAGPAGQALFRRLQAESPAPHALWLGGGSGSALVGNSPERLLRLRPDGALETRPIKGTRPRFATPPEDAAAAAALAADPKDRAEHVMIVDLERNDLGRVCQIGSVQVEGFARVVSLATVHHLVTTVRGQLRAGVGLAALLRATFPGGSITGAPKIRAMEIIDELEPAPRGPYTGATGWLGAAGDLDLAVAIRTAVVRDGQLTLWVGGGIVADSTPEGELEETEVKARAFVRLATAAPPR
jgi:anthranilate/para-aminobenzoate synthase component I